MFRILLKCLILSCILLGSQNLAFAKRHVKLLSVRNRPMLRRMRVAREELKPKICYELVGCFADPPPPPHLALKRPPEHPNVIQTRFFLYTREKQQSPAILEYGDDFRSITTSKFNATKPLKVGIHGFKGSASDAGLVTFVETFLDLDDANVLLLDWTRGAATSYSAAVANTELVGRQLALVLLDMISIGTEPGEVHIVGFSLGAHIAGCTSEVLKKKNILLGRITGLDPASPFFRHHLFRERSKKLDATDAKLVDIIHTDGSEDFADGFGLLKPLGHVDFFPNGGREQPGCTDVKNSVVVSQLKEEVLDKNLACSHIRAFALFVETMKSQKGSCKFSAWPCPQGSLSYQRGVCFPMETTQWSQEMGYGSDRGPLGIYYLATRGQPPFCGQAVRARIKTVDGAPRTLGTVYLQIFHGNSTTLFKIQCLLSKRKNDETNFYNIAAAEYDSIAGNLSKVNGVIWFEPFVENGEDEGPRAREPHSDRIVLREVAVEDRKNNRLVGWNRAFVNQDWEFSSSSLTVDSRHTQVELRTGRSATHTAIFSSLSHAF